MPNDSRKSPRELAVEVLRDSGCTCPLDPETLPLCEAEAITAEGDPVHVTIVMQFHVDHAPACPYAVTMVSRLN